MEQVNLRDYFNSRLQYLYPLEKSDKLKVRHLVNIKNEIKLLKDITSDETHVNIDVLDESYIEQNHIILLKNIENIKEYFNFELDNLSSVGNKSGMLDIKNLENIKRELKMLNDNLPNYALTKKFLKIELTPFQKLYMEKELEREKYINETVANIQDNINKLESDYNCINNVNLEQNNAWYKKLATFFGWN